MRWWLSRSGRVRDASPADRSAEELVGRHLVFGRLQDLLGRGRMIPDLMAILGSIDYVMADVDR
jgi:hypothetical protein